jgi:hypothetical protein
MSKGAVQQILAGDYWVHWTYTQEEWRNYAEYSWTRSRKVIPIGFGCVVLLIIACFIALSLLLVLMGEWRPEFFTAFVIVMAILAGLFIAVGLLVYFTNYRLYRKRLEQTKPYVYISRLGIYRQEGYISLSGLFDVKFQQGILWFKCETHNPRGELNTNEIEVPVPHGCEQEAEQLLRQLHAWLPLRR